MEKRANPQDSYAFEKRLMSNGGIFPVNQRTYVYHAMSVVVWFMSCGHLLTLLIKIFMEINDLAKVFKVLYYTMTQFAYVCKLTNFVYRRSKILLLEEQLAQVTFNDHNSQQDKYLETAVKNCKLVATIFRILCILVVVFYALFPFLDSNPKEPIPISAWFPCDVAKYKYEISIFQVTAVAFSAANNYSIDVITTCLIRMGSAQFEILKDKLQNIIEEKGREQDEIIQKKLEDCVVYHNHIIKYVRDIEDVFSNGIFLQFVASVVVICLTGFQMITVKPNTVQFLLLVIYFSCMMCQVAMYCWYGHDIFIQSSGIGQAFYMSAWYKCNTKILKSVIIIMERTKRPIVLTAGKFVTLTLGTLMGILRSSYSYFAVLQRLYRDQFWG